ncbi:cytochrome C oxidase subunit IV family protein [Leptospira sp. GIMC2001]|uniref:cytochrome C oxidase subunit IV family protein n=1 Tax=Leptospira sp. GIMC2001 TaxID=1513297 RepID=UPI002349EFE9|nr:cytochrome C oxidase subunit IV family protein [Leptospira sp. GIMC2001]WCL48496.1 cytochrome C oxidase subunit IV family protein [Leptospira sp. GIMC2001]
MELVINYGLYFIAIFCVLTPVLAFGIFAPVIAKVTVVGFVVNWVAQFFDLSKEGKIKENPLLNIFKQDTHSDDDSPMWIDNAKPDSEEHHIISAKTYLMVFGALIVGTIITVWVAGFDFGAWNMVIAMLVATAKASLVLLYFMHLKYDTNLNRVIFLSAFFFLVLLFAFSFGDIMSRILPTSSF